MKEELIKSITELLPQIDDVELLMLIRTLAVRQVAEESGMKLP